MKNYHESKWITEKHVDFPASHVGLLEAKNTKIQTQNLFQTNRIKVLDSILSRWFCVKALP